MESDPYPKGVPADILSFVKEMWQDKVSPFGPRNCRHHNAEDRRIEDRAGNALRYLLSRWGTWVNVDEIAIQVYPEPDSPLDINRQTMRVLERLEKNLSRRFGERSETPHMVSLKFTERLVGNRFKTHVGTFLQLRNRDRTVEKVVAETELDRYGAKNKDWSNNWPGLKPLEIEQGWWSHEHAATEIEQVHLYWDGTKHEVPNTIDDGLKTFLWQLQQMKSPHADLHDGTLFRLKQQPLEKADTTWTWIEPTGTHAGLHVIGSAVEYRDVVATNKSLSFVWEDLRVCGDKWSDRIGECANALALNVMLSIYDDKDEESFVVNLRGLGNAENATSFGPSMSGSIDQVKLESEYLKELDENELCYIREKRPSADIRNFRKVVIKKVLLAMAEQELGSPVANALKYADIRCTTYGRGLGYGFDALLLRASLKLSRNEVDESVKKSNLFETDRVFYIPCTRQDVLRFLQREIPTPEESGIADVASIRRLEFLAFHLIDWFTPERTRPSTHQRVRP